MADTKGLLRTLHCHYHPSWKLYELSQLDINKLKRHIERDRTEFMFVEESLYAAFLEVPTGSLYNLSLPSISKAHEYLQQAEDYVAKTYEFNENAKVGYGIVINSCRMWTSKSTRKWEKTLQDLEQKRSPNPNHKYYISAVRAYTLSKLGPEWLEEASNHYKVAIEGIPGNSQWMIENASVIVRLARQKDPTMKSKQAIERLHFPESLVNQVLDLDPGYHRARALRLQILVAQGKLGKAKKESEIFTQEVLQNTAKTNIAEITCKYHIGIKELDKALKKVKQVPMKCRTAEVHFLIGDLSKGKAKSADMLKIALKCSEEALKIDERHYPALRLRAEVNAKLGNYEEAKKQYVDLLDSKLLDKPHLHEHKFHTLDSVLSLRHEIRRQILNDEEYINYLSELLTIAVDYTSDKTDGGISLTGVLSGTVEKRKIALMVMCGSDKTEIVFLANLKLAHFHLRQGNFDKAEKLFLDLKTSNDSDIVRENIEVMWGLFKCYLGKGKYKDAEKMVKEIGSKNQIFYHVEELYADIYIKRAKLQLKEDMNAANVSREHSVGTSIDDDHPHAIARLLEKAIDMGSLEACDTFLKIDCLHEHFFKKSMQIPQIVAKIERVIKNEVPNVHTHVPRDDIKKKIENLLTYPETNEMYRNLGDYQKHRVKNVHTKLSKLRRNILKFEVVAAEVGKKSTDDRNDSYEDAFTEVVLTARFLLDHIVSDYQDILVRDEDSKGLKSHFCIIGGKLNQKQADEKVTTWLEESFPNCQNEVPKDIIDMLVQVQPMYSNDNRCLMRLHHLVNDLKHTGGGGGKERRKQSASAVMKEDEKIILARESCTKVEYIVLKILEGITQLYEKVNAKQK